MLVGYGMAQIALHLRRTLKRNVRGLEVQDISTAPRGRNAGSFLPSELAKELLDPEARETDIDGLWHRAPSELEDDIKRINDLCLRAWLTMK